MTKPTMTPLDIELDATKQRMRQALDRQQNEAITERDALICELTAAHQRVVELERGLTALGVHASGWKMTEESDD